MDMSKLESEYASARWRFFSEHEAVTIQAMAERIFPKTADGAGATDAHVAEYIDLQLVGPWGKGDRMYRQGPFLQPEHEGHGWQSAMTPGVAYRYGIAVLTKYVRERYDKDSFALLSTDEQDTVLSVLSKGGVEEMKAIGSSAFFNLVRQNVIEGLFADPSYGGNFALVGWKWVGFPGDPNAFGNPYVGEMESVSIAEIEPRGLPD